MGIKVFYFDFAGRAEPIRLVLKAGKVDFEDVRVKRDEWPELKKKMPFGQMPAIEADGTLIAQSGALLTYAAKVAGLYPEDPLEAALADQAVWFLEDLMGLFKPTWGIQDLDERIKARQAIVAGPLKEKLEMLGKLIDGQLYVAGDKLSHADIAVFCTLTTLKSGMLDGVPTTLLDDYTPLKDYRNHIALIDFIQEYYAAADNSPFKPDA